VTSLAPIAGPAIVLVGMLVIYKIAFSSRARLSPFSIGRARMRARSVTSSNGMLILAGVNVAALVYQLSDTATHLDFPAGATAALLTICALSALLLLVVVRSFGDFLMGAIGVAATFLGAYLQGGTAAVLAVVVLTLLTLFLLGGIRGFIRPL
jgi:hypothetical protein